MVIIMIKKRNLGLVVLLSIVTFGIYPLVVMCIMGKEVNKICDGDGKNQIHYLLAVLLGMVTFGIYPVVWCCKAMNRLQDNAYRYGSTVHPPHSGSSYVLWTYLGLFIGVGPLVALCQFVSNINAFSGIFGYVEPLPYSENMVERLAFAENARLSPVNAIGNIPAQNVIANNATTTNSDVVADIAPTAYAPGYKPINLQGTLTCVTGMYLDIPFPVVDGETMVIGTNPALCNIVITDDARIVSGKHCSVSFKSSDGSYSIIDHSTNGTYINGSHIAKNVPVPVFKGDIITLGDNRNAFRFD